MHVMTPGIFGFCRVLRAKVVVSTSSDGFLADAYFLKNN